MSLLIWRQGALLSRNIDLFLSKNIITRKSRYSKLMRRITILNILHQRNHNTILLYRCWRNCNWMITLKAESWEQVVPREHIIGRSSPKINKASTLPFYLAFDSLPLHSFCTILLLRDDDRYSCV